MTALSFVWVYPYSQKQWIWQKEKLTGWGHGKILVQSQHERLLI